MRPHRSGFKTLFSALGLLSIVVLLGAGPAAAQTGGAPSPTDPTAPAPAPTTPAAAPGVATLAPDGSAIPPAGAPRAVVRAIAAGNRIRTLPYRWGGGHTRKFRDTGYDCSGAVSFLLHAAKVLKTPLASGSLARSWGTPGPGSWITVYANGGHAYVIVAGLRFDTSAVGEPVNQGSGPRWRTTVRPPAGYISRHVLGL